MVQKLKNLLLFIFSLIVLELISQLIILKFEDKFSILLKHFSNNLSKIVTTNYQIEWDYENNKMKPGRYKNQFTSYEVNSLGFRNKEFNLKKDKNKIRIITLGGSTTIGLESPDNKTYPYQLEELLNEKNNTYEVINMGFSGKSLNFIKNLFFNEAHKYEPDIIVIYSNRNSILYDGSSVEPNFKNTKLLNLNYYFQENIMTYRLLWRVYKKIVNFNLQSDYLKSPFQKKGISEKYLTHDYKNSLTEIINFSKEKKIKVILVKQAYFFEPNIIPELNKFSVEELIKNYKEDFFIKQYQLKIDVNFWSVLGTILNKNIDEFKNYENVIIVDPVNELTSSSDNFTDYLHLTPKGNKILANKIYQSIKN